MIHIYSIEPSTLQDLNTLTDVCRELATAHAQDDPLECGQQWGMIQNLNVKVFDILFPWEYCKLILDSEEDWCPPTTCSCPGPGTSNQGQARVYGAGQTTFADESSACQIREQARRVSAHERLTIFCKVLRKGCRS